jgi:hypothetical protein
MATDDVDRAEALVKKILGGVVIQSETPIYDELIREAHWEIGGNHEPRR